MSYCTLADLIERISEAELIQLTDDAGAGVLDDSKVDQALADADAEIDSYAGVRYDTPFTDVPAVIRKTAIDITIYNLFSRRMGAPEAREKRYADAVKFLKSVANGQVSLGASTAASDDGGPEATTVPADRIFTRDTLSGY